MPTDLHLPRARATAAPAPLEGHCAHLDHVLTVQAPNGGRFLRSIELEYAARRLARAYRRAGLPERTLAAWLAVSAAGAFGATRPARALTHELQAWAANECTLLRAEAVQ